MILTAESVSAALSRPVDYHDGQWYCQVCNRAFKSKQAIGPHQLNHRRAVGLAPPRPEQIKLDLTAIGGTVICVRPGCNTRLRKQNYLRHLRQVHRLSYSDARAVIAEQVAAAGRAETAAVTLVDEQPAEPEPERLMTDLTATEAAAGILSAARRDGLVPTAMLPALVAWIGHTERILDDLARRTDG